MNDVLNSVSNEITSSQFIIRVILTRQQGQLYVAGCFIGINYKKEITMDRRTVLSAAAIAVVSNGIVSKSVAAEPAGKIKYTVLYGTPKDPEAFEKHYAEIHMPLVVAGGLPHFEASKGMLQADGSAPAFFRIFEAWFDSVEQMNALFGQQRGRRLKLTCLHSPPVGSLALVHESHDSSFLRASAPGGSVGVESADASRG